MKKWAPLLVIPLLAACSASASTSQFISQDKAKSQTVNASPQAQVVKPPEPPKPKISETFGFTRPDAVRGIYVTGYSAGGDRLQSLLNLEDQTDLNAMVIDIKDDYGNITYKINDPAWQGISQPYIKDPKVLIETLKQHKIYPIARIVTFKDSVYAEQQPELSFLENGQIWKNGRGESFVNPFLQEVWKHNVDIAKMAAELGFQEIQFDYVRFPEGFENMERSLSYSMGDYKNKQPVKFVSQQKEFAAEQANFAAKKATLQKNQDDLQIKLNDAKSKSSDTEAQKQEIQSLQDALTKATAELQSYEKQAPKAPNFAEEERLVQLRVDAVTDFVSFAKKELEPLGVKLSVDIFGYTATLPEAPGIGQNFSRICENVDVISSMIYPSHWGPGYFTIAKPDLEPYRLVTEYAKAENEKLSKLSHPVVSRPWIQDFTAPWLGGGNYKNYGKAEVEAQIKALQDNGIHEFLLWNAGNVYTDGVDYTP